MSPKASVWLLAAVCVWCVEKCVCFPNGSVAPACGSMVPQHLPYQPSNSPPPVTLSVSSATYRPGGLISVVVQSSSIEFEGFLIQARRRQGDAVLWPVGKFTNIDPSKFRALHCNNMENSTVAQASAVKMTKVQLTWEAPNDTDYEDVYFSVSVVQDYARFWVQMNSSALRRVNAAAAVCSSPLLLLLVGLFAPSVW